MIRLGIDAHKPHRARTLGLAFVFLWFSIGGIAHFAATRLEMRIVPPYIPWPRATVLAIGVCELLGAAGLILESTRRPAGVGLFLLTIAVTPANLHMMQHAEEFNVPYWVLVLRLPLQIALLALIAWSTAVPASPWHPVLRIRVRAASDVTWRSAR
jgi:uncharacterized membrane protein